MLFHMDIQDLEHSSTSAYCTTEVIANYMHTPATDFVSEGGGGGGGACLVLEQSIKLLPSPTTALNNNKSPLSASQSANSQSTAAAALLQFSLPSNHKGRISPRPLTSSPVKSHHLSLKASNNENTNGYRVPQFRQGKHYRVFNQSNNSQHHQVNGKNGGSGVYRQRNNSNSSSVLSKIVFHSKQQNHELASAAQKMLQSIEGTTTNNNGISKAPSSSSSSSSTCDIVASKANGGINNHNSLNSKRHLSISNGHNNNNKKNSKVDLPLNASKNYKRANSFDESVVAINNSRPKKTRRSRKRNGSRKRPHESASLSASVERGLEAMAAPAPNYNKRMRWTECNANEVSRLHRNCVQNGQPLAPYNTTQFIMNEHNAEKEFDFDELSGQLQQMNNYRRQNTVESGDGSDCGGLEPPEPLRDDYYYSSPEEESYFLEQQFHEAYDTMHAERLNSMSKSELLKEYLLIEKELETMRQKSSPSTPAATTTTTTTTTTGAAVDSHSSANPHQSSSVVVTKSPRPPSMPSSPRHPPHHHQRNQPHYHNHPHQHHHLNGHHNHHHHHHSAHHRNLFKENKNLRKMLKQVYSRYSSLLNCIRYVNTTTSNSETGSSSSGAGGAVNLDSSVASSCSTNQVTSDETHLNNQIEKYLTCHPSPSAISSSSPHSNLTTSTSSSSTSFSSSSSSTSTTTNEEDEELDHNRHHSADVLLVQPQGDDHQPMELVKGDEHQSVAVMLQELVDLVVEGN